MVRLAGQEMTAMEKAACSTHKSQEEGTEHAMRGCLGKQRRWGGIWTKKCIVVPVEKNGQGRVSWLRIV